MVFLTDVDERLQRAWDIIGDLRVIAEDCEDPALKEQLTTLANFYNYRFVKLFESVGRFAESTSGVCHGSDPEIQSVTINYDNLRE